MIFQMKTPFGNHGIFLFVHILIPATRKVWYIMLVEKKKQAFPLLK